MSGYILILIALLPAVYPVVKLISYYARKNMYTNEKYDGFSFKYFAQFGDSFKAESTGLPWDSKVIITFPLKRHIDNLLVQAAHFHEVGHVKYFHPVFKTLIGSLAIFFISLTILSTPFAMFNKYTSLSISLVMGLPELLASSGGLIIFRLFSDLVMEMEADDYALKNGVSSFDLKRLLLYHGHDVCNFWINRIRIARFNQCLQAHY